MRKFYLLILLIICVHLLQAQIRRIVPSQSKRVVVQPVNSTSLLSPVINSRLPLIMAVPCPECDNVCNTPVGTITGAFPVCAGNNSITLSYGGGNGGLWQSSTDNINFDYLTPTYEVGLATWTASNLSSTTYFRVAVDGGTSCPTVYSNVAQVPVNASVIAGTLSGGGVVCPGSNVPLSLSGNTLGSFVQWQSCSDNVSFVNIGGATGNSYTATNVTATTYYRALVTDVSCSQSSATTASVQVTINSGTVTAGTISGGGGEVCNGSNSTLLTLTGYTAGSIIQWYSSTDNQNFSPIPNATSATYTSTNISTSTYYSVIAAGTCVSDITPSVQIQVVPGTTWVLDDDNDGYYVGSPENQCASPGTGWVALTTQQPGDCDDTDPNVHTSFSFYADNDHDGYGAGSPVTVCAVDADTPPYGFSTNSTDCDDTNPNVHSSFSFYADNDHDGYGAGSPVTICAVDANTPPYSFSMNSTDCDDTNPNVHLSFSFYADNDHDGYGAGSPVSVCAPDANTPPYGFSTNSDDCDDTKPNVHMSFSFYADNDHDGYGAGSLINGVCAVDANTPPVGFSTNNTDCDDTNPNVHSTFSFYADNDHDGYGTGSLVNGVCAVDANTPPAGFSTNNTDCDDTNPNVHSTFSFYVDHDHDGYGTGVLISGICAVSASTPPVGYSTNNTDCNDNDATSHVAAVAGAISGGASVCAGCNSTVLTLSGNTGTRQWQSSINNSNFTNIAGATGQTYTANNISANTYYRVVVSNGGCPKVNSTSVAITMGSLQNAASFSTTNVTLNSATLNWVSSYNPGQWQIEYKSTSPGSPWIDAPFQKGTIRSITINGLKSNQNYQWHIRDNCGKSWTAFSNAITFKTLAGSSTRSMAQADVTPETPAQLAVRAMPNPTSTNFIITIKGNGQSDAIKMIVVDIDGRMIEQRTLPNEQTITIGDHYFPGIYIVRFIQGDQNQQLKLIKLPQ